MGSAGGLEPGGEAGCHGPGPCFSSFCPLLCSAWPSLPSLLPFSPGLSPSCRFFAFPAGSSPLCPLTHLPLPLPQGIVGNLSSGKSALVHRYLTGTYVQEESPEGEHHGPSLGPEAGHSSPSRPQGLSWGSPAPFQSSYLLHGKL